MRWVVLCWFEHNCSHCRHSIILQRTSYISFSLRKRRSVLSRSLLTALERKLSFGKSAGTPVS